MAVPAGRHNDWPWPFSLVPRRWTAVESDKAPRKLAGSASGNLDVPKPGEWAVAWPPFVAITTKQGWHARLGARYDYVDRYFQVPSFTVKKIQ